VILWKKNYFWKINLKKVGSPLINTFSPKKGVFLNAGAMDEDYSVVDAELAQSYYLFLTNARILQYLFFAIYATPNLPVAKFATFEDS
jgi:hypothetical protein